MKRRDAHEGDRGRTRLADGASVSKCSARVAALGAIDELNAALGLARSLCKREGLLETVASLQRDLLALGSLLARANPGPHASEAKTAWSVARTTRLDDLIEATEAQLPPLHAFVLPGGSPAGAALQWARTVCRRAEREAMALAEQETVDPSALSYVNRLSDLLFALARAENQHQGVRDEEW
jgi:cob(I)alamin adenosyltransferase